jgi:cephalosporin-C deacetylase-like acetyl esterase
VKTALAVGLAATALAVAGCTNNDEPPPPLPPPAEGNPFSYDASRPLHVERFPVGGTFGPDISQVNYTFDTFDDERVPASVITKGSRPRPCVLFVAGLGNSLEQAVLTSLSFVGQGYTAVTVEPRFHGTRMTDVTAPQAGRDPRLLEEMVRGSVIDLRRALDFLFETDRCRGDEVAYVGLSFGGILGSLLVGVDDRIGALVSVVAGGDWRAIVSESEDQALLPPEIDEKAPQRFEEALELLAPVDPARWIGRTRAPVLMINGTDDQIIPDSSAEALHEAARQPKEVYLYEGTHNAFLDPWAEDVGRQIGAFVEDWRDGL